MRNAFCGCKNKPRKNDESLIEKYIRWHQKNGKRKKYIQGVPKSDFEKKTLHDYNNPLFRRYRALKFLIKFRFFHIFRTFMKIFRWKLLQVLSFKKLSLNAKKIGGAINLNHRWRHISGSKKCWNMSHNGKF